MKQVVFAIALLAMASLTGCLNTDDDSSDTTPPGKLTIDNIIPTHGGGIIEYSLPEDDDILFRCKENFFDLNLKHQPIKTWNTVGLASDASWETMSVPGSSNLISFQPDSYYFNYPYDYGGLIVGTDNINIFTD